MKKPFRLFQVIGGIYVNILRITIQAGRRDRALRLPVVTISLYKRPLRVMSLSNELFGIFEMASNVNALPSLYPRQTNRKTFSFRSRFHHNLQQFPYR